MKLNLVVTEKPSVAMGLSKVLGATLEAQSKWKAP